MAIEDGPRASKYNFMDSAVEALSFGNIVKRIFLFLVFGLVLGLRTLISNIDAVGREGGGFFAYISALSSAMWQGVVLSLGSMWSVMVQPSLYLQSHSWGSIIFSALSLVFLVMFFYQPVSLVINIIDGQRGQASGALLRVFVTVILILILSSIVFYAGGGDTLTTNPTEIEDDGNGTIDITTGDIRDGIVNITDTNTTDTDSGGSVISLL